MDQGTCRRTVVEFLKKGIINGEFQLGERIQETRVARALGLSRAPVREAFMELCNQGLVALSPNRGAKVVSPTASEIRTSYLIAGILEGYAVSSSAHLFTQGDFDRLQGCLASMKAVVEGGRDIRMLGALDIEFHTLLVQRTENRNLTDFVLRYNMAVEHMLLYRYWATVYEAEAYPRRHLELFRLLQEGAPEPIEAAVRAHYMETGEQVARYCLNSDAA